MPDSSVKWGVGLGLLFLASTAIKDSVRVFDSVSVTSSMSPFLDGAPTLIDETMPENRQLSSLDPAMESTTSSTRRRPPFNGHGITTSTRGTNHDPLKRRTVLTFTTMPSEVGELAERIRTILGYERYKGLFDAIHVNVPWFNGRKRKDSYPATDELEEVYLSLDDRVLLHRLMDYGPLTRYVGAVLYEKHPETQIITFDVDSIYMDFFMNETQLATEFHSDGVEIAQLPRLVQAAQKLDSEAVWCCQGEDFTMFGDTWAYAEHTFEDHLEEADGVSWNKVMMCRAAKGISVRVKHFDGLGFNGTDYHPSCWFDDDRFLSFQWELLNVEKKQIHGVPYYQRHQEKVQKEHREKAKLWAQELRRRKQATEQQRSRRRRLGTLSILNRQANPRQHCTKAFLEHHPDLFPLSRNYSKFNLGQN